jgi:hypothetical protein
LKQIYDLPVTNFLTCRHLKVQNHSNAQNLPGLDEQLAEDIEPESDKSDITLENDDADDSDLPISTLINLMTARDTNLPATVGTRRNGTLTSFADAENIDLVGDRKAMGKGRGALTSAMRHSGGTTTRTASGWIMKRCRKW